MRHQTPSRPPQTPPPLRIIRHVEVRQKLGIGASSLFELIAAGQFPKPFELYEGGRSVGWLEPDVDAWIMARARTAQGAAV